MHGPVQPWAAVSERHCANRGRFGIATGLRSWNEPCGRTSRVAGRSRRILRTAGRASGGDCGRDVYRAVWRRSLVNNDVLGRFGELLDLASKRIGVPGPSASWDGSAWMWTWYRTDLDGVLGEVRESLQPSAGSPEDGGPLEVRVTVRVWSRVAPSRTRSQPVWTRVFADESALSLDVERGIESLGREPEPRPTDLGQATAAFLQRAWDELATLKPDEPRSRVRQTLINRLRESLGRDYSPH
jgi:hypothetical protein